MSLAQARNVGKLLPVYSLQDALAAEIRAEMAAQRLSAVEMQRRAGIKHASWRNWFVTATRPVPFPEVEKVCDVLGVAPEEMVRRARVRRDAAEVDASTKELLEGLRPGTRRVVHALRDPFTAPTEDPGEQGKPGRTAV